MKLIEELQLLKKIKDAQTIFENSVRKYFQVDYNNSKL